MAKCPKCKTGYLDLIEMWEDNEGLFRCTHCLRDFSGGITREYKCNHEFVQVEGEQHEEN